LRFGFVVVVAGSNPAAVPLPAAPNDENTDGWFLSGGASGENALEVCG
jgi:hypothetical protein